MVGTSRICPRATDSAPTTTSTSTTPTNARSSEPFEKDTSVDAPIATIGATAEEEEDVEDDGTTKALARSGVTDLTSIAGRTSLARGLGGISLMRTAGRASLVRVPGEISLARTALRATLAFPHCCHHQEGMMTTTRTRGLGASRSLVPSLAS